MVASRSEATRATPIESVHMSSEEIRQSVNKIMVDEFEVEPKSLVDTASLNEDLDMDSLDGVDLVVALEKTFACRIPEEEARGIRTLGDIYAKVEAGLARVQEQAS
jgi:acyl carrier protein